jgi:hypothetical protein
MNSTNRQVVGVVLGFSMVVACRGSQTVTPDSSMGSGSDAGPTVIHIQDIQNTKMAPGTPVELHGVIVTALDRFGNRSGDFFVEEPGGGPLSGVHVFGAPAAQIATLAPGDIVDITGAIKSEFTINGDTSGRSVTEVQAPRNATLTVTKTGSGAVPAPDVVDALKIGKLATQAERDAEWEKWEGVLIRVDGPMAFGDPACITSQGVCTDLTLASFTITGQVKLESALSAFPTPVVKLGDCFASVTGIVDYAFDYLIYPRSTTEMVTGGTTCPPRETGTNALCADGADNDGNGFIDCKDFSCSVGPDAWLGATCTPADAMCGCSTNIASGMSASKVNGGQTGPVLLHDVFVTAVGTAGYWVADALQAGPSGGLFVFTNAAPPATIVQGKKLGTLQGIASQLGTKTQKRPQVANATAGGIDDGGDPLAITTATTAQVSDLVGGAQYMSSLVTLTNVKVSVAVNADNQISLKDNAGTTIVMDDAAFAKYGGTDTVPSFPLGTCFASLTGVMDLQTTDQFRTINPRSAADMVTTDGACTP